MENPLPKLFPKLSSEPSNYVLVKVKNNQYFVLYKPTSVWVTYLSETGDPLQDVIDFLLEQNVEQIEDPSVAMKTYGKPLEDFYK